MAINITNVVNQIETRLLDSGHSDLDLNKLIAASNRINNSGVGVLTYRSPNHLPDITDSNYIGRIAYVEQDNVLGDSDGRFFMGTGRTEGWVALTSLQDSAESTIVAAGPVETLFYQGVSNGYTLGGYRQNDGNVPTTTIQEYSLASDGNATDVGDFSSAVARSSSTTSSSTHAYSAGGSPNSAVIHKVPFASGGTSTPVGQLSTNTSNLGGVTGPSHGYAVGGSTPGGDTNVIEKYSFSSDGNATDVGDTTVTRRIVGGGESETYGYAYGGFPAKNEIEKWPFASDENATDVGDLLTTEWYATGTAGSDANGYIMGATGDRTRIQKHSFATDGNSTDVSNLTGPGTGGMGVSGVTHGYNAGGLDPGNNALNVIQKFPYAAETDATDVGDLVEKVWDGGTGAQV